MFQSADPAGESPGETIVGWCLRLILRKPESLRSQYEVDAGGRFFLDFAVPEAGLAIEVTGFGKFGTRREEAYSVGQKLVRRQQLLDLMRRLPALGVPVKPPSGPCWDPSMTKVFARSRRF